MRTHSDGIFGHYLMDSVTLRYLCCLVFFPRRFDAEDGGMFPQTVLEPRNLNHLALEMNEKTMPWR